MIACVIGAGIVVGGQESKLVTTPSKLVSALPGILTLVIYTSVVKFNQFIPY
jgi:hypothetical protein